MDKTVLVNTSDRRISNPFLELWEKNGIIFARFSDNLNMDLEIAKSCVQLRLEFSKAKSFPVIIDMRGLKSVSKEAREYMASQGSQLIKAGALVVGSPVSRILGNIFLLLNRPPVPSRLFAGVEEAEAWIKQYM